MCDRAFILGPKEISGCDCCDVTALHAELEWCDLLGSIYIVLAFDTR